MVVRFAHFPAPAYGVLPPNMLASRLRFACLRADGGATLASPATEGVFLFIFAIRLIVIPVATANRDDGNLDMPRRSPDPFRRWFEEFLVLLAIRLARTHAQASRLNASTGAAAQGIPSVAGQAETTSRSAGP